MKKQAFNPYLPSWEYVPDAEPHIVDGRVYVYGSHDLFNGINFCLGDYVCWSAPVDDLGNWTYHGCIFKREQDPAAPKVRVTNGLAAPDMVVGPDGKYYLYYFMGGTKMISVAVCDEPAGEYTYIGYVRYPDGSPMKKYVCFDPCAFNDNGTIRIYYGTQYQDETNDILAADDGKMQEVMERYNKSREEILSTADNVNGACMAVLEDDMLTVKEEPVHIFPYESDFGGHEFFEASSMRKVGDKYYFIYSSQKNHELCYAVSDRPDGGFRFMGTLVSNGDIGVNGVTEETRMNMTGTTHGSIICINGQWYVFYHRLTHKSDYSRQACAEKIYLSEDGTFAQAEMTSCGLNDAPLTGKGSYPAVIACNITNGKMPHGSNKIFTDSFPNVNHRINKETGKTERCICEISEGTLIGYRYFRFESLSEMTVTYSGDCKGVFEVCTSPSGEPAAEIQLSPSAHWTEASAKLSLPDGDYPLFLRYKGTGTSALLTLSFN